MISDLSLWVSTFNWEPVELSGFFSVLNYILEVSIPLCWVHWESLWGAESEPTAAASDWPRAPSEQKQWIFLKWEMFTKYCQVSVGPDCWVLDDVCVYTPNNPSITASLQARQQEQDRCYLWQRYCSVSSRLLLQSWLLPVRGNYSHWLLSAGHSW